ncbi:hypothetical protein [Clostridium sp.]|uniref:hypothetical protein n=1 Tax=Clostridium sp. TaxID=1506 RepID=UPI00257B71F0|nr:hypothetical protein [Clostridium sp.]MBE6056469.1 hypothetical protein [Clostridium sp.]
MEKEKNAYIKEILFVITLAIVLCMFVMRYSKSRFSLKSRTLFINELEEVLENETLHNKELFKD